MGHFLWKLGIFWKWGVSLKMGHFFENGAFFWKWSIFWKWGIFLKMGHFLKMKHFFWKWGIFWKWGNFLKMGHFFENGAFFWKLGKFWKWGIFFKKMGQILKMGQKSKIWSARHMRVKYALSARESSAGIRASFTNDARASNAREMRVKCAWILCKNPRVIYKWRARVKCAWIRVIYLRP